ncbi:MAG: two-component regulator propeller domain-containing protein [Rhodothermales bacterium]
MPNFLPALLLMCTLLAMHPSHVAQARQDGWTAHTSMRSAIAVASGADDVWVATTGGAFGYRLSTGEIKTMTMVDGLSGVQPRAVAVDDVRDQVWLGYGDGVLDRVDLATGRVTVFRDIARATQFASRGINRIHVREHVLYIGADFGVVVFDPVRDEVRDSYTRLGTASPAIPVRDIAVGPAIDGTERIWTALPEGLASAPLSAPNLQDPSAWQLEFVGATVAANDIRSLAFSGSTLYVGTARDLYVRAADGNFLAMGLTAEPVSTLRSVEDGIVGAERFRVIRIFQNGVAQLTSIPGAQDPTGATRTPDGSLWASDANEGLLRLSDPSQGAIQADVQGVFNPNGPSAGNFSTLTVATDGTLWAGGANASNTGFHRRNPDGSWDDFTGRTYPVLNGKNRFLSVYSGDDATAWFGSEGGGLVHVVADELEIHDASNSSLLPATGTDNFVVVGGVAGDEQGRIWTTTRASGVPLHARDDNGTWRAFGPYVGEGLTSSATAYGRIHVDSFGQKWVIVRNETNFQLVRGLMVLQTGDISTPEDDRFRFFGSAGGAGLGLPSTTVTAITEDRDGLVWIGTSSGPAYFVNTGVVARDASARAIWPQWADRSNGTFMLFGLRINDIAVDPANRLWFATSEGAWLVEAGEGGFTPVQHFTTENSPLFSNEVLAVAVDDLSGEVYFSTDRGALSWSSDAVAPSLTARELTVYPNPLRLDATDAAEVMIDGLVEATDIRIVTAAGSLVRRLESRGGRVAWDARDETGQLVSSGVYLVIAVGRNDEGTAYGRIAVIR